MKRFIYLTVTFVLCFTFGHSIVDDHDVWAEKKFQRIVSLGGGITETLFALGLGQHVVAVDVSSLYPPEVTTKPKVGYVRATSAEGIASMKPDIVIASSTLGPPAVHQQLKKANIRLELITEAKSVDSAMDRIMKIAVLFDRKQIGQELVKNIKATIKKSHSKPVTQSAPKVLFLFSHGSSTLLVAGDETIAQSMIKAAGGKNAVSGYKGYKPLTAESVVLAKPDLILMTTRSLNAIKDQDMLWKTPGIALTPAGKNKRVHIIDDLKLLGYGPRVGEAIQELRQAFFPSIGKE